MKSDNDQMGQILANAELNKHKVKYPNSDHNRRQPINGDCFLGETTGYLYEYKDGIWLGFKRSMFSAGGKV
jgi:hypothetical protein